MIAAVVIGGGSLNGGEGTVLGTLIGCLIMSVLYNGCVHAGIPNATQDILIGIIIVAAVALDRLRAVPRVECGPSLCTEYHHRLVEWREVRLTPWGCATTMPDQRPEDHCMRLRDFRSTVNRTLLS